jgi:agmatine/peptidylarginine deiminase
MKNQTMRFPAEWEPQSGVIITFPHEDTDWQPYLEEALRCFASIAREVLKHEKLIAVCRSSAEVKKALDDADLSRAVFCEIPSNDTWTRDFGPVSVFEDNTPCIYDFTFNGWGLKFPSNFDNMINRRLFDGGVFSRQVEYRNCTCYVLEGGSIESDGHGTVMTTSRCMMSPNRNDFYACKDEIESEILSRLCADRVLWLDYGGLAGDDTDGHIDTLARFCDVETIAYVKCENKDDEHFDALSGMERQLMSFRTSGGRPYRLLPLPMAEPVYWDGERLPATYANFLIINGAVLYPTYGSPLDSVAGKQLQKAFPDRRIVGIDCRVLIRQHGSLHCVTMQLPEGFLD